MCDEFQAEVLAALSDSVAPLTLDQLYQQCEGVPDKRDLIDALNALIDQNQVIKHKGKQGEPIVYTANKNTVDSRVDTDLALAEQAGESAADRQIAAVMAAIESEPEQKGSDAAIPSFIPTSETTMNNKPTITLELEVETPPVPDTVTIKGIQAASLDEAFGNGGQYKVPIKALDNDAIDTIATQWAEAFKAKAAGN